MKLQLFSTNQIMSISEGDTSYSKNSQYNTFQTVYDKELCYTYTKT